MLKIQKMIDSNLCWYCKEKDIIFGRGRIGTPNRGDCSYLVEEEDEIYNDDMRGFVTVRRYSCPLTCDNVRARGCPY